MSNVIEEKIEEVVELLNKNFVFSLERNNSKIRSYYNINANSSITPVPLTREDVLMDTVSIDPIKEEMELQIYEGCNKRKIIVNVYEPIRKGLFNRSLTLVGQEEVEIGPRSLASYGRDIYNFKVTFDQMKGYSPSFDPSKTFKKPLLDLLKALKNRPDDFEIDQGAHWTKTTDKKTNLTFTIGSDGFPDDNTPFDYNECKILLRMVRINLDARKKAEVEKAREKWIEAYCDE